MFQHDEHVAAQTRSFLDDWGTPAECDDNPSEEQVIFFSQGGRSKLLTSDHPAVLIERNCGQSLAFQRFCVARERRWPCEATPRLPRWRQQGYR